MNLPRTMTEILATVEHVEYSPTMCADLDRYVLSDVASNAVDGVGRFELNMGNKRIGVSQWVTPKRTRSYPYARVYDTLQYSERVAIVPLVKDEGSGGDRDYLNWDTVSLMSLLNVYVIPAYYESANPHPDYENKITDQRFDYEYITRKIRQLDSYQGDALHWNMREMENLGEVVENVRECYFKKIPKETGVQMSSEDAFERRIDKMTETVEEFINESRRLSSNAQKSEAAASQANENVIEGISISQITLENFLGGKYHFTVDEAAIVNGTLFLVEKKHSSGVFPSEDDIKDGLLKLALYSNISSAKIKGESIPVKAAIGITGEDFPEGTVLTQMDTAPDSMKELYSERFRSVAKECNENSLHLVASDESLTKEEQLRKLLVG